MSIGKTLLRLRIQAGRTQREVADAAGISVSYLSRLENNRAAPSLKTLSRVSEALGLDVGQLFEGREPADDPPDRCPVSLSGRCILDQLVAARGRRPAGPDERYSAEQLELLRTTNFLLHCDDVKIFSALRTLLRGLLELAVRDKDTPPAAIGPGDPPALTPTRRPPVL